MSKIVLKRKEINEDGAGAPANSAGGGGVASIGINPAGKPANWGEPGISKGKKKTNVLRRKPPQALQESKNGTFAGHTTFIVPSNVFHKARLEKKKGKHWRTYIGEDEHGVAIRDYDRKHKGKKPIILQDESTGAMCYAKYGKKEPPKNLQEAPLIKDIKKGEKFNYATGTKVSDETMKRMTHQHVGSIGDHDIHYMPHTHRYQVRHRKTGKVDAVIQGKTDEHADAPKSFKKTKSFEVHTTDSTGKGPKMHKVYRKILQSGHATSLVGSSHSEGGQKLWQRLSSERGVSVHGWHRGKPVNIDPKDPEETHVSTDEAEKGHLKGKKDPVGKAIYKMKLVASLHKRKTV
jgi:hypothetical protein